MMPETRNRYKRITRSTKKDCSSNSLNKSVESPLKNITNAIVLNRKKSGKKFKTSPMKRRSSDFSSPDESTKCNKSKKESITDHNNAGKSKDKRRYSAGPSGVNDSTNDAAIIPQKSNSDLESLFPICKGLSNILGSKYINVTDRLKLDSEPYCVKNMNFCHINHSKKCPRTPSKVNMLQVLDARSLSANNRHLHFLKRVEDMCLRSEFPGETIMYKILEIILTINLPEHESDTSKEVITECVLVFEHILRKFPPCWHDIHENYKNLLNNPIDIKKILEKGKYCEENIYTFVLSTMESVLSEPETPEKSTDADGDSFWETKYNPKHYFNLHSRSDKLERLFIVLHLVTKILEFDLSLWMLRHLSKPVKHLFGDKKPLVVTVFGLDPYKHITLIMKKTLNIFVRCACFSYPEDDVNILSRIISLLAVTINLEEINSNNNDRFIFPHYDRKTTELCIEIFNTVDSVFGRCIIDYVTIINNVKIPLIKYLLIDYLLGKMNRDQGEMSPEKIALNFRKKRWLECREQTEPRRTRRNSSSKYPIIPKNVTEKPKGDDIYRHEYLKLLLDALEAYCDVYDIKNWVSLFKNNIETETPKRVSLENQRSKLSENDILNLDLMEADIEDLESKLNMKQKRKPLVLEASVFEGIQVGEEIMIKCRKDIKYLLVLQKNLDIFRSEYGKDFDNWIDFIRGRIFQVQH